MYVTHRSIPLQIYEGGKELIDNNLAKAAQKNI